MNAARRLADAVLAHGCRLVATARQPEQLSDLVTPFGDRGHTTDFDDVTHQVENERFVQTVFNAQ